jgi:type IV secretion system protein VirB1
MDLSALLRECAPVIEPALAARLVKRESSFNPYAIGLDGRAVLKPQPQSLQEAVEVAEKLIKQGQGFSVGMSQLHISNVRRFRITWRQAFDPCTNLKFGQSLLQHYHTQAVRAGFSGDAAVFVALRGYNSGDIHNPVSNGYAEAILGTRLTSSSSVGKSTQKAAHETEKGRDDDFFSDLLEAAMQLPAPTSSPKAATSADLFDN